MRRHLLGKVQYYFKLFFIPFTKPVYTFVNGGVTAGHRKKGFQLFVNGVNRKLCKHNNKINNNMDGIYDGEI